MTQRSSRRMKHDGKRFHMNLNKKVLASVVVFVILAPFDSEQSDLIHRIHQEANLIKLPLYK